MRRMKLETWRLCRRLFVSQVRDEVALGHGGCYYGNEKTQAVIFGQTWLCYVSWADRKVEFITLGTWFITPDVDTTYKVSCLFKCVPFHFCLCSWIIFAWWLRKYGMLEGMAFEARFDQYQFQNNLAACIPFLSFISQMGVFPLKNKSGVAAIVTVIFLLIILTWAKLKIDSPENTLLQRCQMGISALPCSHQCSPLLSDHIILSQWAWQNIGLFISWPPTGEG